MTEMQPSLVNPTGIFDFLFSSQDRTKENLFCPCGSGLIKHYNASKFVDISLVCPVCRKITQTPRWPRGELIPFNSVCLKEGATNISGTVEHPTRIHTFSTRELKAAIDASTPLLGEIPNFCKITDTDAIIEKYNSLCGGIFEKQKSLIDRKGKSAAKKLPFVWAVLTLREFLRRGPPHYLTPDVTAALMCVNMFIDVVSRWQNHGRFTKVAADLGVPESYFHTIAALQVATYLFSLNIQVGISLENRVGHPNPDLYIPFSEPRGRIYIEVKAPMSLQFVSEPFSYDGIERAVLSVLKESRHQITKQTQGAIVITGSHLSAAFGTQFEWATKNILEKYGERNKDLAAFIIHYPIHNPIHLKYREQKLKNSSRIDIILNRHFREQNPFIISGNKGSGFYPMGPQIHYV